MLKPAGSPLSLLFGGVGGPLVLVRMFRSVLVIAVFWLLIKTSVPVQPLVIFSGQTFEALAAMQKF